MLGACVRAPGCGVTGSSHGKGGSLGKESPGEGGSEGRGSNQNLVVGKSGLRGSRAGLKGNTFQSPP